MGKSREIKNRIKAVANIRRITRTMQMIATAKFSASQQKVVAGRPYSEALFAMVAELASGGSDLSHPLLASGGSSAKGGKELTLILSSERGLCGPYNGSVLRTAMGYMRENEGARDGEVEVVGKKGLAFAKFNELNVSQSLTFGDTPRYEEVERLAQRYIDSFTAGEITSVKVVYMKFFSAGKQEPTVLQLLPLEPPKAGAEDTGGSDTSYEFSPAGPELLAELVPAAIKATLFQAFNDAVVSEHVARMVAMKAATDNAAKMGKALSRKYNRARQAQITTELTEIISGAAALD